MMRKIVLLAAILAAAWTVAAQSRTEEFSVKSTILGKDKTCSVYLPAGYDDSDREYPVLYLLHGADGGHTNWLTAGNARLIADEAIAGGMALPMIIVMPDASPEDPKRSGWREGYFNRPGWNYEQFFFEEFMPAIEKQYRIRSDKKHRAIAGLSMGGGGTVIYALHHPELFGSACPLSALIWVETPSKTVDPDYSRAFFANCPLDFLANMTDSQAADLRTVRWWVDCGDDDFLYEGNIRLFNQMRKHNIPLEFRMRDGGHTWRYWQTALPDVLNFISIGFAG